MKIVLKSKNNLITIDKCEGDKLEKLLDCITVIFKEDFSISYDVGLEDVLSFICRNESVSISALKGNTSNRLIAKYRGYYYTLARAYTNYSLEIIGRLLNRSHSQVISGIASTNNNHYDYFKILKERFKGEKH